MSDSKAVVLLGLDATESRLTAAAVKARFLHVATHHVLDGEGGSSFNYLALTLPERASDSDDGFLMLADVLEGWRGKLRGCELVVLSGCETNRGLLQKGEGVFAMPIGFMYAGCPSIIASQWRVDDDSTALLMADFYERLVSGSGGTKLDRFTAARRALRKTHPEPYHWAPFIFLGDPR